MCIGGSRRYARSPCDAYIHPQSQNGHRTWRMLNNIYVSLAGGISGNPFSNHYSDLLDLWLRGSGINLSANSMKDPKHHLVIDSDSHTRKN